MLYYKCKKEMEEPIMWLKKNVATLARANEVARVKKAFGCLVVIVPYLNGYTVSWKTPR
jgi:hypothetical protein